mgnify:CR=1 FL=1
MNIIVDAMGGDNAPLEIVKGAMLAVDEFNIDKLILVGDEKKINSCVKENNITLKNTQIKHCTDEITMCDDAKSVLKKKPDSSLAIGFKLLNDGEGDAFVSALRVSNALQLHQLCQVPKSRLCLWIAAQMQSAVPNSCISLACSARYICKMCSRFQIRALPLQTTAPRKQRARLLSRKHMPL